MRSANAGPAPGSTRCVLIAAGVLALGAFFYWALQPNVDDYEDFMPEDTKPARATGSGGLRDVHRGAETVLDAATITRALVRELAVPQCQCQCPLRPVLAFSQAT